MPSFGQPLSRRSKPSETSIPNSALGPGAAPRVVRVFVSSTFRDMKAERDELGKQIFPALRKLCDSRGVTWGEVDMRWGVTDEQKADGQVLPICLAEIRGCRPYFIGLLGERYGWVPEALDDGLLEQEPWLAEHAGRSVTELEILHGVLNNPAMAEHTFFYLRNPAYTKGKPPDQFLEIPTPDEIAELGPQGAQGRAAERQAKLAALKDRIRSSGLPVHEGYSDPRALGEAVLADLSAVIERLYPAGSEPDPLTRESAEHEAFARSRSGVYIGRPYYFERLDAHASSNEPPLAVLGESGSGKSALLANWVRRHRQDHPDELVLVHFIGASPASTDWAALVRRIIGELSRRLGLQIEIPDKPDALRMAFANALYMAAAKGRVVLVLDALNQLEDREGALDLAWLPSVIPANVCLVLSTLPGRSLAEIERRSYPTLAVSPLETAERERLIVDYLAGYKKALGPGLRQRIAAAPQCANPLYLRALLEELRLWGEHETLPAQIDYYIAAPSVASLYELILGRYEADYERDRPGLVRDAFSLLWAGRRGLSETELLDMLGTGSKALPRASWSPLYLASEYSLTSRSGLLGFFHDYLREAVEHRYVSTEQTRQAAHLRVADYFAARENGPRKIDELPWQLARAHAWQRLADLLADLDFLDAAWRIDELEVKAAWAQVEANSAFRLVAAYRSLQDAPSMHSTSQVSTVAYLLRDLGHTEQTLSLMEYLVGRYRETGNHWEVASLGNLARTLKARGDLDRAMALYKEEEGICRELGDKGNLQRSLGGQGMILFDRGDLDRAMALYKEEERLCRELGNTYDLQRALGSQANIAATRGRRAHILKGRRGLDEAMGLYRQNERFARELGDRDLLRRSLGNQSVILSDRGKLDEAMALDKEKERICRELGDKDGLQSSFGAQAENLYARGDLDGAMAQRKQQELICRELGNPDGLARCLASQALILGPGWRSRRGMGRRREALPLAEEAYRLANQHGLTALAQQIEPILDRLHN